MLLERRIVAIQSIVLSAVYAPPETVCASQGIPWNVPTRKSAVSTGDAGLLRVPALRLMLPTAQGHASASDGAIGTVETAMLCLTVTARTRTSAALKESANSTSLGLRVGASV